MIPQSGSCMKARSVDAILKSMNSRRVRYLIVGGLAVNAHGVLRLTLDLDLVVQLEPVNIRNAFAALATLGYRPTVPVTVDGFADRKTREGWIRDKGMMVLQFFSDAHRETTVDVFVKEPFGFATEYKKALVRPLTSKQKVRFVSLPTLLKMKQVAGRTRDLADIEDLKGRKRARETKA